MKKLKLFLMLSVLSLLWTSIAFADNDNSTIVFFDKNLKQALIDCDVDINGDNEISKLEAENCTKLDLKGKNINILGGLEYFINLNVLNLENNNIVELKFINELPKLRILYLKNNNIDRLTNLPNINSLDISFNKIKEIEKNYRVKNLTVLNLSNNNISDLSGLEEIKNLTSLNLNNNKITDISPLSKLTKLKYLLIGDNEISDINSLSELTNINELYLSNNSIRDIRPIGELKNLESLYLSKNKITEISVLGKLSNLEDLDLSGNPINNADTERAVHVKEYDFYVNAEHYEVWVVTNINLNYIKANEKNMFPKFSNKILEYCVRVDNSTTSVEFKISPWNENVIVKFNGELADKKEIEKRGEFISYIIRYKLDNLKVKDNLIKIQVEDEYGIYLKEYSINIYRNYIKPTSYFIKNIVDMESLKLTYDDMKSIEYENKDILQEMCEKAIDLMKDNDNDEFIEMLIDEIPKDKRKYVMDRFEIKKMILDHEKYIDIEKKSISDVRKEWKLKFNNGLNQETIRVGKEYFCICDEDGNDIEFKFEYDEKLRELKLIPTEKFERSKKYYLLIGSKVESINKKRLTKPIRMEFSIK